MMMHTFRALGTTQLAMPPPPHTEVTGKAAMEVEWGLIGEEWGAGVVSYIYIYIYM